MPGIGVGIGIPFRKHEDESDYWTTRHPELGIYITGLTTPLAEAQIIRLGEFLEAVKTGLSITNLSDTFDVMYLLAGETSESALKNLVEDDNHATLSVTAPAFSAFNGFTGGADKYINTNYNPSTEGDKFVQNNASFGFYSKTSRSHGNYASGSQEGASFIQIRSHYDATQGNIVLNSDTPSSALSGTSYGLFASIRVAAANSIMAINEARYTSGAANSNAIPNRPLYLLARNAAGTADRFDAIQMPFAWAGKGLSQAEFIVIKNAVENYLINAITLPVDGTTEVMTLTSTGDGTGISTLKMEVSEPVRLTLSGAARFYLDSAATKGASTTCGIFASRIKTVYIKCPSGTCNLTVEGANKIINWGTSIYDGFVSAANAASIGGNISSMTAITTLSGVGNNTLSGDTDNLPSLIYMQIGGNNTLTGDIANLNVNITKLSNSGALNTMYGSIAGLVNLTNLTLYGTGVVTGSCAALTALTHFYIVNKNNTISGDITALTSLTFLEVRSPSGILTDGNTLSGSLAGLTSLYNFWIVGDSATINGSLAGLTLMQTFRASGAGCAFSGDMSGMTVLANFSVVGTGHTFTANMNALSNGLGNYVAPSNRIVAYTSGATWTASAVGNSILINPSAGYGLDQTEVDNMLIDMANSAGFANVTVELKGANAARSAASNAAVATLNGRGVTVLTN